MSYTGYLYPWTHDIHRLWNDGLSTKAIAEVIHADMQAHPEKLRTSSGQDWPERWGRPTPSASMVRYVLERSRPDVIEVRQISQQRPYPSEQGWRALLPPDMATAQVRWERLRTMERMRSAGFTCVQIGRLYWITGQRVRQLLYKPLRASPLEVYLRDDQADLQVLAKSKLMRRWAIHRPRVQRGQHLNIRVERSGV